MEEVLPGLFIADKEGIEDTAALDKFTHIVCMDPVNKLPLDVLTKKQGVLDCPTDLLATVAFIHEARLNSGMVLVYDKKARNSAEVVVCYTMVSSSMTLSAAWSGLRESNPSIYLKSEAAERLEALNTTEATAKLKAMSGEKKHEILMEEDRKSLASDDKWFTQLASARKKTLESSSRQSQVEDDLKKLSEYGGSAAATRMSTTYTSEEDFYKSMGLKNGTTSNSRKRTLSVVIDKHGQKDVPLPDCFVLPAPPPPPSK